VRFPADDKGSLKEFMDLRAATQNEALVSQAAERFAERNSSSPEQKELMLSASRTALQTFVRAGFDGLISRVPEAERERILGFAIPMIQFTLSELRDLLRQQQGLPELDYSQENSDANRWIQSAVLAFANLPDYPAPVMLTLDSFEQVQASVFQVARSPGMYIVYLGCLFLIIGLNLNNQIPSGFGSSIDEILILLQEHIMTTYQTAIDAIRELKAKFGSTWRDISPEDAARMQMQNQFKTGLDIAKYTAAIMRRDMAEYDADSSKYTQSLGCWHGFIAQQKMIANKKYFGTTSKRYIYLSGWMVAALRSEFGPLPDQSMHEKTSVPALIEEIYTFLRQADAKELNDLFRALKKAQEAGDTAKAAEITAQIDGFQTHVVPIIADIDAGFGNEEATYLLARKMIEAGACALQIENQVSDAKQCGHQAGKVTVPHEDFIAKIHALRYAFLEMGLDDGIIVARTDSEGADLTQKNPSG
jgi:hypothetical protein